ncbi:hypothetical protein AQUCO_01200173v1 [Aquilegia coerulea]|uniref:Uncharacterized protein n=1 Tax=Aquilegia coerulea TaxID=218851 RepID=A0A2G5E4T0_AQUCA|nr:hypothetical protein AQUCO_01200173v1 [Aquilegia coerulea]
MALQQLNWFTHIGFSTSTLSHHKQTKLQPALGVASSRTSSFLCLASTTSLNTQTERRSANYKPNIWEYDFLKTVKNDFKDEVHLKRAVTLKDKVRQLISNQAKGAALNLLELVDDIQRLGMGYLFEGEIRSALGSIKDVKMEETLHETALRFRLFRQHGFIISQDIFRTFKDPQGNFKESFSQDVKGLLSLYEASYLSVEGEDILDEAKAFARLHLKNAKANVDSILARLVNHALDLPLNLGIVRLEARWYINLYEKRKNANHVVLELAKLDYNMVQAAHLKDVVDMSKWWNDLGLSKTLTFARDRLVESFLWSVGIQYEPQYKYCREGITKLIILITTIDDVYDVYSTYEEAKLFTEAVERWDVNTLDELPDYMRACFLALYNTINEIAYNTLKEHGLNVLPYLKKTWEVLCNAYLLEAKWFHSGYKPKLNEFLDNAWVSTSGPLILLHSYILMDHEITKEALDYLQTYPNLIRWSSMITRLTDDMGTSKAELERGDVPKSIQCYMNDAGVTDEVAREHVRHLTDEAWKKMNAELWIDSPLPEAFVKVAVNFGRTGESFYQYEDGHGVPDGETRGRVLSLLVDTVPLV